jgi:hypothetical protein
MDALKAVPQFFFDLIGRMVPGSALLLLLHEYLDPTWAGWLAFLRGITATPDSEAPATTLAVLALMLITFAMGHLLAPLTKLIQSLGEVLPTHLGKDKRESENYAWLRLYHAEAGGNCAKLRAEFTMYNGLSGASLIGMIASLALEPHSEGVALAFLVLAILMASRGREGRKTFSKGIREFCEAAEAGPGTRPQPKPKAEPKADAQAETKPRRKQFDDGPPAGMPFR